MKVENLFQKISSDVNESTLKNFSEFLFTRKTDYLQRNKKEMWQDKFKNSDGGIVWFAKSIRKCD